MSYTGGVEIDAIQIACITNEISDALMTCSVEPSNVLVRFLVCKRFSNVEWHDFVHNVDDVVPLSGYVNVKGNGAVCGEVQLTECIDDLQQLIWYDATVYFFFFVVEDDGCMI